MSDPRNVAHAKKVTQEKKHAAAIDADTGATQPGKKAKKKQNAVAAPENTAPAEITAAPPEISAKPPAALEASLTVLAQLRDLEFHSRANLERLAGLTLTVEEELKQKQFSEGLGEVYSAQDSFQTKLTALLEAYKTECDRMQSENK
jgi:hypothetical protein